MISRDIHNTSTTLSASGQIVINKNIRKMLKLKPGTKFIELVEGDRIILKPMPSLLELKGALKGMNQGKSTKEVIHEIKMGWK